MNYFSVHQSKLGFNYIQDVVHVHIQYLRRNIYLRKHMWNLFIAFHIHFMLISVYLCVVTDTSHYRSSNPSNKWEIIGSMSSCINDAKVTCCRNKNYYCLCTDVCVLEKIVYYCVVTFENKCDKKTNKQFFVWFSTGQFVFIIVVLTLYQRISYECQCFWCKNTLKCFFSKGLNFLLFFISFDFRKLRYFKVNFKSFIFYTFRVSFVCYSFNFP